VKTVEIASLKRLPDFRVAPAVARPAWPALRAIVLLSGTVGTGGVAGAAKRPALTLPVDGAGRRLLDCWLDAIQRFVEADDVHGLPVRVLTNALPESLGTLPADNGVLVRVETDPAELRGTAGLLRDAAAAYDDDEAYILMLNAAQLPVRPLAEVVHELTAPDADVAFHADDAGHAGAMMLIRCACLRAIPPVGFVDLKEQALAQIARRHRVSVLKQHGAPAMPMRTAAEYVRALRWLHRDAAHGDADGAFAEDWAPRFSILERGATVHATARLHDSVVLGGGTVHRGAVLVRSVVCAGGVVPARATVVDAVVTATN
jgi:hypothetical protein